MSDIAIEVRNLSKRYRIGLKEEIHDTFIESITSWLKSPISNYKKVRNLSVFSNNGETDDILWALKDVSFDVKCGEVLGIIGKNGAGKSTLLKVLCRITEPTSGRAVIKGHVASLLEVGTGFHQELTGRENLYLNGVILGMSKSEIDRKFDKIVDFSGVEQFIDTPVKRYSSGMRVRLAFSVAAHLEPDILIIDEVLAVGDVDFQNKCIIKMDSLSNEGRTVLLVSHNMSSIQRLCDRVLLLEDSRVIRTGTPDDVITSYYDSIGLNKARILLKSPSEETENIAEIRKVELLDHKGVLTAVFDRTNPFFVKVEYKVRKNIDNLSVLFGLQTMGKVIICRSFNIDNEPDNNRTYAAGTYVSTVEFPGRLLNFGIYTCNIALRIGRKTLFRSGDIFITLRDSKSLPSTARSPKYANKIILSMPLSWRTEKL